MRPIIICQNLILNKSIIQVLLDIILSIQQPSPTIILLILFISPWYPQTIIRASTMTMTTMICSPLPLLLHCLCQIITMSLRGGTVWRTWRHQHERNQLPTIRSNMFRLTSTLLHQFNTLQLLLLPSNIPQRLRLPFIIPQSLHNQCLVPPHSNTPPPPLM